MVDVIRSRKLWDEPKQSPSLKLHNRASVLKPLSRMKEVTSGQLNAAWRMQEQYLDTVGPAYEEYRKAA